MKNENWLILADTQFPYVRQDYLSFCDAVRDKHKCIKIAHVGDVADCLNFSDYDKDPYADNAATEQRRLIESFELWSAVFPVVECVVGNHDARVRRKLDRAGFSEEMLSTEHIFRHVFGFPDGWTLNSRILIPSDHCGTIQIIHGDERGVSQTPGLTLKTACMSTIFGHTHTRAFISYHSTHDYLLFDMCVGCGIDKDSKAFLYDKRNIKRPIFGCGVIVDGVPNFIPMRLDHNGDWNGVV